MWNRALQPLDTEYVERFYRQRDERGKYQAVDLTGAGLRDGDTGQPWRDIDPSERGRHWAVPHSHAVPDWVVLPGDYSTMTARQRLEVLDDHGLIYWPPNGTKPRFKRYISVASGTPVTDMVTDIPPLSAAAKERTGYPTQKPVALLDRIIQASSDRDGVVLDPFCGCATALIAAEKQARQWVGIDISETAATLVQRRLRDELSLYTTKAIHRTDIPRRTDIGVLPRYNSPENKRALYGQQEGNCEGCRQHFEARNLEVDHIIARAKGGTDHLGNLQLLCASCNRIKGDRGMAYLRTKLQL